MQVVIQLSLGQGVRIRTSMKLRRDADFVGLLTYFE